MAYRVPNPDKGAVQKADYFGDRRDKGAVEAHEPTGNEAYITAILSASNTINTASAAVANREIIRNVTAFS